MEPASNPDGEFSVNEGVQELPDGSPDDRCRPLLEACHGAMPVASFLAFAENASAALAHWQRARLAHGGLNPYTLLVNPRGWEVRLLPPAPAEGGASLPYLAPEQSGRINRRLDPRSDCYALGIVFYQLLTGQLPFQADDPLEWIHAHVARLPLAPHRTRAGIPAALSDIIMKMLEKPPEQRYQGTAALQADLNRCARQWQARGTIERFMVGSFDVAARLAAPQRVLGRDAELATMLGCYEQVVTDGGPALLLVSGYAGVGKSTLVGELETAVLRRGGIFIAGKFDQYKRHTPYATVGEALRQLVQTLLAGDARSTADWRTRLRASLQGNAVLLFDLLPPLRTLLGDMPALPELPPKEALHRFYQSLHTLAGTLCSAAHPLTMVLDDLHWADPGSLALLDYLLVEAPLPNLLVVGTYRDNEVRPSHPLALAVRQLGRAGLPLTSVFLAPLPATLTARLTADVLRMPLRRVQPLAALVHRKTAGNPLFALQFLRRLEQEDLLRLDTVSLSWTWDLARIEQQGYTDNVVDLIVDIIKGLLSGPTLSVLQCAACLGQAGSLELLSRLDGQGGLDATHAALHDAVDAGIVELTSEDGYRFSHDRFQQAAYSMVPMAQRSALHLRIARLLDAGGAEDALFEIADHFNLGAVHVNSDEECRRLVQANLRAGQKAKAAGAYASATHYLASASRHLGPGGFDTDYPTAFTIHIDLATCEFLTARAAQAEQQADLALRRAASDADRLRSLRLKIEIAGATGKHAAAIDSLAHCGRLLGADIDTAPTRGAVEAHMERVRELLGEREPASLAALAPMTDERCRSLLEVLRSALPAAFLIGTELYESVILAMVTLSLRHGNGPASAVGYIGFAKLCCRRGWIALAARFEALALALAEQEAAAPCRAEVHFVAGSFVSPDTRPMRAGLDSLQLAFDDARARGDQRFAAYCCYGIIERRSSLGHALPDLLHDIAMRLDYVQRTALKDVQANLTIWRQSIRCLRGETSAPATLDGDGFTEQAFESALGGRPDNPNHLVFHGLRLQARYLLGDYRGALDDAQHARAWMHAAYSMQEAELAMFHALAAAALYPGADDAERPSLRQSVADACAELERRAAYAPANFGARHLLVGAELARIDGQHAVAMDGYARAIESADREGYVHLCALAYELAAEHYRERGLQRLADSCLQGALDGYQRWGAEAKVEALRERFPGAQPVPAPHRLATAPDLDLLAVAKAVQSISGEVATARLHETLLRIVLEHAGAQSGQLLLACDGQLHVQAMGEFKTAGYVARSLQSVPLASSRVPHSVIEHVAGSGQALVLDDAADDPRFAQDPYLANKRHCAVLCLPIQRHQRLSGILYAENCLLPSAFRAINLDVLELLITQAAISLENATLYEHLQESQARLTAVMDNVPAGVYVKDLNGRYQFINRATEINLGMTLADVLGKTDRDLFADDPGGAATLRDIDLMVMQQGRSHTYEENMRLPTGQLRTFLSVKAPLIRDGKVQGLCGISTDVSEQREARERIEYLARYDALTGLPNRTLLIDYLDIAIANARRGGQAVALLFLDLDRFKAVNDSLGHWAGDLVLKEVAARLRACVRETDTVARLAGDEFIVVVGNLDNPDNARQSAQKVIEALARPMHMKGHHVSTGVSIGISLFPQDAQDAETLLKLADMAMYHAKPLGREKYQFFDSAMNQRAQERLMLENQLRGALGNGELYLEYQPQLDLRQRRIVGAEVLLRWRHPQHGLVPPSTFIPIAEDCGLIGEITHWVIEQACAQLSSWRAQGLPPLSLAINISALCLMHNALSDSLAASLLTHGLDGAQLELEMTEGILMRDVETSICKLRELKLLGVSLAIDDFGTGYSSLSYLKQLPVDKLKIDQSFVRDIAHDPDDSAITSTIIAMAKHLKLKVIAEGVEDAAVERFLCEHECDQMQGFLFSRPVSAEALAALLRVPAGGMPLH